VQASHNLERVSVSFDDDTLLPNGGLAVAALLAQKLGVGDLVDEHVTIAGEAGANGGAKAATVIGSALAGGDCIDDIAVLRAGATPRLFDGVRAPSTVGIWLRSFTWGQVRQLDRVTRELLRRAWAAGLGPPDLTADLTIDIDSTVCETYGLAKQGGEFAYTGVRGYHPLVASLAQTGDLLHTRLRGGKAASGRGAARFVAETFRRVRGAGATGKLTLRADSGFYAGSVVSACRRHNVAFSITARKNPAIQRAIDAIPDEAWTPIPYWLDGGADVAETTYTAFSGRHKTTARLIVRRVRPTPGSQLALDVVFSYHAILTNRQGPAARGRSRSPPPCDRRAHHLRSQASRRAGAPAVGTVRRERRLARAGRDRLQPRTLDLQRRRPGTRDHQDSAADHHRRARPARDQRSTAAITYAHRLALGGPHHHRADHHRRDRSRTRLTSPTASRPYVRHGPITIAPGNTPGARQPAVTPPESPTPGTETEYVTPIHPRDPSEHGNELLTRASGPRLRCAACGDAAGV
jgi:hypothetical protein